MGGDVHSLENNYMGVKTVMGYLSLYRKWRPQTFDDLVGQPTVVKTLKNALLNNRIAHAYLFCGPRGTGKTSAAKVFAKALNCAENPTTQPCNQCFSCQQINSGRSVDVMEMDAASNRRIDEIRDLREKVNFSPSEGPYKVYIIDEVHMLTKEAFNALLKTLEEPPENVVFILATTEPHKVISTIKSRCQRFDFGLFATADLSARMRYICAQEGVSITEQALTLIARAAQGGMRDAISILDQAIAFAGERVTVDDVTTILGKVDQQILAEIVQVIATHDTETGLTLVNQIANQGRDLYQFVQDLLYHLRDLLLIKECGLEKMLLDIPVEAQADLASQAEKLALRDLIRCMEILSETDQKLKFTNQPRLILEMAIIKLASPKLDTSLTNLVSRLSRLEENEANSDQIQITAAAEISNDLFDQARSSEAESDSEVSGQEQLSLDISLEEMEKYWELTLDLLNNYKETRQLRAFCLQGKPATVIGDTLYIAFPESSTFHKTNAEKGINILTKALNKVTGQKLKIRCIFQDEQPSQKSQEDVVMTTPEETGVVNEQSDDLEDDPIVQKALKIFGGKVLRVEKQ